MSKKILIIEDETLIVEVLSIRIENLGYEVQVAYDGEEGLKKIKSFLPDLALIDVGLPKIDGNTLCELIKSTEKTKNIKVIMLTGKKLVGDMEKSFSLGADAYVSKPYEWPVLLNKIQKLIS